MESFKNADKAAVLAKVMTGLATLSTYLGTKNFMEGAEVTMNDFALFEFIEMALLLQEGTEVYDAQPTLSAFRERMMALPKFADYYNSPECLKGPITPAPCKHPEWN